VTRKSILFSEQSIQQEEDCVSKLRLLRKMIKYFLTIELLRKLHKVVVENFLGVEIY
jgi:hypothetical protein